MGRIIKHADGSDWFEVTGPDTTNSTDFTELIQSAIARLTELRRADIADHEEYDGSEENFGVSEELFTTLYGTIDAQLQLLELALSYGDLPEGRGSRFVAAARSLATAISSR